MNVLPRRDRNVVDSGLGMAGEAYGLPPVGVDADLTSGVHVVVPPGQGQVHGVDSRNGSIRVVADLDTCALLYFTDAAGIQWVKRDGQLWRFTSDTHWISR